jgi:hypothetical protein
MSVKQALQRLVTQVPAPTSHNQGVPSSSGSSSSQVVDSIGELQKILNKAECSSCPSGAALDIIEQYVEKILLPSCSSLSDGLKSDARACNPAFAVSIVQLRAVYTAMELLWSLGIQVKIEQYSGFALPCFTIPNAMTISKNFFSQLSAKALPVPMLLSAVQALHIIVTHDLFAGMMLDRFFDRLLLCYFVFAGHEGFQEHRTHFDSQLQLLLTYSTMTVTKLRSFAKAPSWLRQAASSALTRIVTSQQGVAAVLSAYLEGMQESPHFTKLQSQVARMLAAVPQSMDAAAYYRLLGAQAVQLVLQSLRLEDQVMCTSLALLVQYMCSVQPVLASEHVLAPLC